MFYTIQSTSVEWQPPHTEQNPKVFSILRVNYRSLDLARQATLEEAELKRFVAEKVHQSRELFPKQKQRSSHKQGIPWLLG